MRRGCRWDGYGWGVGEGLLSFMGRFQKIGQDIMLFIVKDFELSV